MKPSKPSKPSKSSKPSRSSKSSRSKSSGKALVTLLLDRSGSMESIRNETVLGINAWLAELRKSRDDMRFSLIQFDQHQDIKSLAGKMPSGSMCLEKTYEVVPVAEIPDMTLDMFHPRGGTPLIDAACATIRAIDAGLRDHKADKADKKGKKKKKNRKDTRDIKIILAIQTDGKELHSVENSWKDLKSLVNEKEAEGWEILFMGAGIDAYSQAGLMGISEDKTLSYGVDMTATRNAFTATAQKSVRYASGDVASMGYTRAEKRSAGDNK